MKHCTQCGSVIDNQAKFCGSCGAARPASPDATPVIANDKKPSDAKAKNIGCAIVAIGLIALVAMCSQSPESKKDAAQQASVDTEDRKKGFHCLSKWDGSSDKVVDLVKAGLRDPSSFEHAETRITPASAARGGKHVLSMRYRAKNGFGGMNVETAVALIDPATCAAEMLGNEPG